MHAPEAPVTLLGGAAQAMRTILPSDYVYDPEIGDPENGVAPGTPWEEVPDDWLCPDCSLGKEFFERVEK